MDQAPVQRDATSTVLRLLHRLCAAAPAPGGAWREAFIAFLWRLWIRLRACKNRHGAAPVPVADTRTRDTGDDDDDDGYYDAQVSEDDEEYLELEGALHIERTKKTDANLAGPYALGKDDISNSKNAELAGPGALGVADTRPLVVDDDDDGYFSCESKVTEEDADARSKNDDAGNEDRTLDMDVTEIKNAQATDLAGAADLGKDDMCKNAKIDGPAVIGIKSKEMGLGDCSWIEVQKAPAPAPWGSARAGRAPARAFEEEDEDDERRAIHLKYVVLCASLKGNKTYCFSCFMENQLDPSKRGKKLAEIEKKMGEAKQHMDSSHKSRSDPRKCKKQGCFAMSRIPQDIGHHEKYAHGL